MKVGLAMSGGIDSSVCLYLLKKQNYDVFGITLKLTDDYIEEEGSAICKSRLLCKKFGIEHIVLDYREQFKSEVIDDFNSKIFLNKTPIPCSVCNKFIKLGKLVEFCKSKNAKLATGHYACIKNINYKNKIFRAKDVLKDQTHFLYDIKKEYLNELIFPLGEYLKTDVYRIAKNEKILDIEEYKESQEVCFFNGKSYIEYVNDLLKTRFINDNNYRMEYRGDILYIVNNKKLGEHKGLMNYTIGQRQGLGIAWKEPLYVVFKDVMNNILYVGEESCLYKNKLIIKNVNILDDDIYKVIQSDKKISCKVCLRDKTPLIDADIIFDQKELRKVINNNDFNNVVCNNFDNNYSNNSDINNVVFVKLKQKARAITSGQACVFYKNNQLLGGGEIV